MADVNVHMFKLMLTHVIDLQILPPILGVTKIACALLCLGKDECSSFFYQADQRSCVPSLTRHFKSEDLNNGTGYKYYITRPDCTENWELYGGHCYYYQSNTMSYYYAKVRCADMGGYLAKTDSADEDAFIRSFAERGSFWIGGEKGSDGKWTWQDGSPMWAQGQPDGDGACLEQWGSGWNDGSCWYPLKSLCEK